MKKLLILPVVLIAAVAWWATSVQHSAIITPEHNTPAQATYPADFEARLRRVQELSLEISAVCPADIPWQDAAGHPPAGCPDARTGGVVRLCNAGPFPANFLRFGSRQVQFFHQNLLAATEIPLVGRHPRTGTPTAGVAEAWATVGNTVYFRINPRARYTNGSPVNARDYLLTALLQAEQRCHEHQQYKELFSAIREHPGNILSVELRKSSPEPVLAAARHMLPSEPGFYHQFPPENTARHLPPGTGPYRISHVEKGRLVVLRRVPQWWGEQLPLCSHRFNADSLEYHFLTSEAQVWEFFLRGKLDLLQTRNISAWQQHQAEYTGHPTLVYDAEYPLPPYGIAFNSRTLPELELRKGLQHAMDMERAVQLIMRGEGRRLSTFSSGYGELTPRNTGQYHYSPEQARACFSRAGYTTPGPDGILCKPTGERLSVRLLYTPHEKISNLIGILISSAAHCGAEIVPEPVPWQICQRQLQEQSHQLVFWAVPAPEYPEPALFLSPDAAPEFAPFALDSPAMNAALEAFEHSPDKKSALARIDQLVHELAIWLPGWKENRVYLIHQKHLHVPPSPWCFDAADAHMFWCTPDTKE